MIDIRNAIKKITGHEDLTEGETRSVFEQIMGGEATPAQIGAFLVGLRMKGETVDEITGAARVMREKALKINVSASGAGAEETVLDTCGTGGTGKGTFNISTTVAFVAAGCGVKVAKHGNRAASGKSGSADVLESLGVKIDVPPEVTERCVKTVNIGFLFAPLFHKAMKYAMAPRREIGVRTLFNLLGPLSNPASATCQVIGVYDEGLTEKMAKVLGKLGIIRAYVVHGMDNFDEVTLSGRTKVSELNNGKVSTYFVTPETFGIKSPGDARVGGGSAEENARIMMTVLRGEEKGSSLDIVLMNASVALMAAGKVDTFEQGVRAARESIDSGKAREKLEQLITLTNQAVS